MANTLTTIDMITREAQRIAHEKLTFISTVNRQYDSSFANKGAKIGDTLRIREPNQYTRRKGSRVMNVQDQAESSQALTVATQDGVDMRFNSAELALSIDELSKRYIEPAVSVMVSGIEGDMLAAVTKDIYQTVGVPGTPPTDLIEVGQARAKLNQGLAPKDDNRCIQADSVTMGGMVNGLSGLFQDSQQIKKQYREGMIGRTAGADWYENERTYSHTVGSDVTTVTVNDAAIASGDSAMTIAGGNLNAGDVFTFAGVYDVHPETKVAYAHLKQFTVSADCTTALTFQPALISTGAKQNVSALPANGAALVFVGTASTAYRQNLMYHKDAFTFVTADLPIMDDAHKCVRREQDGLSMRCWQGSDIRNDDLLLRLDILYGYKTIRPDWACRITN